MGRCYEFGVSVAAGCEHAMVADTDADACTCPDCGVVCSGRFDGCASVWARRGATRFAVLAAPTMPAADPAPVEAPPPAVVVAEPEPPSRPASPVPLPAPAPAPAIEPAAIEPAVIEPDPIEALRHELHTRDVALGEAFERLIASYDRLMDGAVADRDARDRLIGAVELLAERLAELEGRAPAPLFPFHRRDA